MNGRRPTPAIALAITLLGGAILAGCSSGSDTSGSPGASGSPAGGASSSAATTITATEKEFSIDLSSSTAPAGPVTFEITNEGTTAHEFVVLDTDLAASQLPLVDDGTEVTEDAPELEAVDEVEDIAAGATESLTVDLEPGHYVIICNLPAHYPSGMRTEFTVTE